MVTNAIRCVEMSGLASSIVAFNLTLELSPVTVANTITILDHEFGGHFPGVDNPPGLISDIRELGNHWRWS
jgi:hypothetical protein